MKNLVSTTEGVWKEIRLVSLSEPEIEALKGPNSPEKTNVLDRLRLEREVEAGQADSAIAQSVYLENKPSVLESEYQLIAVSLKLDDEQAFGIINCRINKEHVQIRF